MSFPALFEFRSFLLFLMIFSPLELLLPAHRNRSIFSAGWRVDVVHFFVTGILIRLGFTLLIGFAVWVGANFLPKAIQITIGQIPLLMQIIAAIIIADIGFYVSHRLMHAIPFLWHFHAVHHSSETLDWLASYRVHPVDSLIVRGSSIVPVFALGFSNSAIAIAETIYVWHALLLHSNVKLSLGAFGMVVATPHFHHWHHARDIEAHGKNFAGQISFLDVLFGTAYLPGVKPTKYGVSDDVPPSYWKQLWHPFSRVALVCDPRKLIGASQRLRIRRRQSANLPSGTIPPSAPEPTNDQRLS